MILEARRLAVELFDSDIGDDGWTLGCRASQFARYRILTAFDGQRFLIEVHLIDFSGDLYGRELEVGFISRLRDEQRFESQEARLENRAEMLAVLDDRFGSQPRAHWYEQLNARGVLVGEVRTYEEILAWEQPRVNGAFLGCTLGDIAGLA